MKGTGAGELAQRNQSPLHSPVLYPNPRYDSWSYTFATAGTHHYYDDYTLNLKGTVIVTS